MIYRLESFVVCSLLHLWPVCPGSSPDRLRTYCWYALYRDGMY